MNQPTTTQEVLMADTQTRTQIAQVGTVIVQVSDQDRALEFFTAKLGFEKRMDVPYGGGQRWLDVAPAGGATTVALVPPMEGNPVGGETGIAFSTSDVDADHAALRERGVDVDEEIMRGDDIPSMFWFRDPDGNRYLIVQSG
jgi:catechol 2,3-dioxygenase-like lactoylglutathione lyase family enzyme